MESNVIDETTDEYAIYIYINFFFTMIGMISYLAACLLFELYYKAPNLIKNEIFTYILFHTFKTFVGIILSPSFNRDIFVYCFGLIEFFLIISYLNSCFTSKSISDNTSLYELEYKYLIFALFIFCSFPYEKCFKLTDQYLFSLYIINLMLAMLFFRYINIKMALIIEYLKDKKMTNSSIPDLYLPYVKANYYFNYFNTINNLFLVTMILVTIYYIINILNLFFEFNIFHKYLVAFSQEFIFFSIIGSFLALFYCLNKEQLIGNNKFEREEDSDLNKFGVVDVDIQHDENEQSFDKNNLKKLKNNNIDEKEDELDDKGKKDNQKIINDESQKLKN